LGLLRKLFSEIILSTSKIASLKIEGIIFAEIHYPIIIERKSNMAKVPVRRYVS